MTAQPAAATLEIAGAPVARHYGDPEAEYRAVCAQAGIVDRSHEARIQVAGRDRADLLHRMSTNDLITLQVGEARPTVFTTAVARTIDLAWVLNRGEDWLMIASPGQGVTLRRWLAGYIFFQDEVTLTEVSAEFGQIGIHGPEAAGIAETLLTGAADLAEDHFMERDDVLVWRARPLAGDGFAVIAPRERMAELWARALGAGAAGFGEAVYQILRVEAGLAYVGHEISQEYIPLEASLWKAVSFSKGCYIGQEIIARMESRGRLAKTLVALKAGEPLPEGGEVHADGRPAGLVSSAVVSPAHGPIALAFVKPALAEPGQPVAVVADGREIVAAVASLPLR